MALTRNDTLEFYDGDIHVIDPDGKTIQEFTAQDYMEYLEEKT